MTETYGFTRASIAHSTDPNDPFVLHIHASRDGAQDEQVLIATVDDERPMLAMRILRMLQDRGIAIEGRLPTVHLSEPDISFLTMRGSLHEDYTEWTDLEVRYVDGGKEASASFPDAYEEFAKAMYDLFGPKEPAYRRFAMFRYEEYSPSGGWDDFADGFDTAQAARNDDRWTQAAPHHGTHVSIVDLATMTEIDSKYIQAASC